ncbi:MAG: rhodanese-like domain-containing protein [Ignavibacteriales bacterium]|nr:rhodanese-like domain-containing protein [Ignavibacteriales bacterium]
MMIREVTTIVLLAVLLALVYNAFSGKGIPLIRMEPKKVAVSDSALFSYPNQPPRSDTAFRSFISDTTKPKDVKVISPLRDRALTNRDSVANLVKEKKNEQPFKIISLDQLNRLLASRRGVLLDARSAEDFQKGHIKGAKNVPGQEVDQHFAELVIIPRDTLVIVYCNNPECHLGRMVIDFMSVMEFKSMVLYDDGWDGWVRAKMPIDSAGIQ